MGIKTGYTQSAGNCLSIVYCPKARFEQKVIIVTLGANSTEQRNYDIENIVEKLTSLS